MRGRICAEVYITLATLLKRSISRRKNSWLFNFANMAINVISRMTIFLNFGKRNLGSRLFPNSFLKRQFLLMHFEQHPKIYKQDLMG